VTLPGPPLLLLDESPAGSVAASWLRELSPRSALVQPRAGGALSTRKLVIFLVTGVNRGQQKAPTEPGQQRLADVNKPHLGSSSKVAGGSPQLFLP
jgi:hypothetical protein